MLRDAVELPESEEEFNQIYFENLLPRVFPSVSGSLNVWFQIISVKGLEGTQIGTETFPSESTKQTHLNQIKKIQSFIIQGIVTDHVLLREEKQTLQQFRAMQPGRATAYRGDKPSIWEELLPNNGMMYANEGNLIFDQIR